MSVPRRDKLEGQNDGVRCRGCANTKRLNRMVHHWGWLNRGLADHLGDNYGQEYVSSGKMEGRILFIKESKRLWEMELKLDKTQYSLSEAYNQAALRLRLRPQPKVGIEASQPTGDKID